MSVINWGVIRTWPTEDSDGDIKEPDYVGVTQPSCMKNGARYWDVHFDKRKETVTMVAEALDPTINYAQCMGHHILLAQ